MPRDFYDAVVIGGGPAGSAAAFTLSKRGLRTCLVDRRSFPREKLCGGLVTPRSKRIFEQVFDRTWDERLFLTSNRVRFFSQSKHLAEISGRTPLFFTMRYDFDNYLLGLAKTAGAVLRLGNPVVEIDFQKSLVHLGAGDDIEFAFLVGADGVNSQVAKQLFGKPFNPETIGFGLEAEVPRQRLRSQEDIVEIDFAAARWGYGWAFPRRESFTIGVGGIHKCNPDLRSELSTYLAAKGIDIAEVKVKGQYIPFGGLQVAARVQ